MPKSLVFILILFSLLLQMFIMTTESDDKNWQVIITGFGSWVAGIWKCWLTGREWGHFRTAEWTHSLDASTHGHSWDCWYLNRYSSITALAVGTSLCKVWVSSLFLLPQDKNEDVNYSEVVNMLLWVAHDNMLILLVSRTDWFKSK